MSDCSLTKPCIVPAKQGFTLLYKDKFLYSKYNPEKTIMQSLSAVNIQAGTVILCNSPALFYGLKELIAKLPQDSFIIFCEFDSQLNAFSREQLKNYLIENQIHDTRFSFPEVSELYDLPVFINKKNYTFKDGTKLIPSGTYRRFISIDFSAGTQFNTQTYKDLLNSCSSALMTYWTNRVTLTKFGRKYSANLFSNIKILSNTKPITSFLGKINRSIIVFGAGESTDSGINEIRKNWKNYYILCADTALQSLLKAGIIPDGVFIEEAQHVISKAFIGTQKYNFMIFAGITSIPLLHSIFPAERISYFYTEYTTGKFLDNLKKENVLPYSNPAFGSVGLTAVYYALKFRKDPSVPVFVYGLDFSYSLGKTHAKETMAHKNRLMATCRFSSTDNIGAAVNSIATEFADKSNNQFYTTPILKKYSDLFNGFFAGTQNIFDSADTGIPLNIQRHKPYIYETNVLQTESESLSFDKTLSFIKREIEQLTELKNILTGKIQLSENEAQNKITEIAEPREYLYLHFPDGMQFQYNLSFLKRIRTEIDYFLKKMQ